MALRDQFLARNFRCLLAVAAPKEARAITRALALPDCTPFERTAISDDFDLILTGVGKAAAAASVARAIDPLRHSCVINLGIAGALPESNLPLLTRIAARRSTFADEGSATPQGFRTIAAMGFPTFPDGDAAIADPALLACIRAQVVDAIATVSTCSGTNALASEIVRRTGAQAEAMEGAAVGLVASRFDIPFVEVRVISNTTGDRDLQTWALDDALRALGDFVHEHHHQV